MLTTHPTIDRQIDQITVNADALIADFLEDQASLHEIARKHRLSLPQLIAWFDQPAVRALLDQLDELADRRADSTAARSRHAATMILSDLATAPRETSQDTDLAGKAARALYRKPRPPTRHGPKSPGPKDDPEPTPTTPTTSAPTPSSNPLSHLRFPVIPLHKLSSLPTPHSPLPSAIPTPSSLSCPLPPSPDS